MNQITAPPLTYDAGLEFNYANWAPGSTLTFVNVPWNNDYRDIVRFASKDALSAWVESHAGPTITKMTPMKFGEPIKVQMGINAAQQYNYCKVSNPGMYGDTQNDLYYFILEATPLNAGVTRLVLQLDTIQTFGYSVKFGNCYIERGHIGIANSQSFNNYGRDYLTVPEGLDIGGEYRIVHTETQLFDTSTAETDMNVLICSTVDLTQDPVDDTTGAPGINSSTGGVFNGLPTGAAFYVFKTIQDFETFMTVYSQYPWMTQAIISITLVPLTRFYPSFAFDSAHNISPSKSFPMYYGPGGQMVPRSTKLMSNWRAASFLTNILGPQYSILKKFLTFPYLAIELTAWNGKPIIIKPESWQDPDATVNEIAAFMPPGQRIALSPNRYNADGETTTGTQVDNPPKDDDGEFLDFATFIDSFPTLPIVNNMALQYLAANRNGLAWENRSAEWSQQRALASANTGANQATVGIQTSQALTGIQTGANSAQAALQAQTIAQQALIGGLSDVAGGAAHGAMAGPAGIGLGVVGGGIQGIAGGFSAANQQNQVQGAAGIANSAANASNSANVGQAMYARDSNLALAQFAAQGDYANQVAGINARIQDAMLTQPSTAGQFGGDSFNLANGIFGYSLRWKMPSLNSLRQLGDYWLRYGYQIHQYGRIPDNWMVMSKFTYWKLTETYILTAPIPESFKQIIRGIFEKGVTVWADPSFIGQTALSDNTPLQNVSY